MDTGDGLNEASQCIVTLSQRPRKERFATSTMEARPEMPCSCGQERVNTHVTRSVQRSILRSARLVENRVNKRMVWNTADPQVRCHLEAGKTFLPKGI